MSQPTAIERLNADLHRRRQKADADKLALEATRQNRDEPASGHVQDDAFAAALARFSEAGQKTAAMRAAVEAYSADKEQSLVCAKHDFERRIDWNRSTAASVQSGTPELVYAECPGCATERRMVESSAWLVRCGVPEILRHASFETFICETPEDTQNLKHAREFAAQRMGILVIEGTVGNGKSMLAAAIMRAIGSGLFRTQKRLLADHRQTYNHENHAENIMRRAMFTKGVFVLDELKEPDGGRDEMPLIDEILSERHGNRRKVIITTNLLYERVKELLGERLSDRLKDGGFKRLIFSGSSRRERMKGKYFSEMPV